MMLRRIFSAAFAASVLVGCSGQPSMLGASEPFRIRGGQFIRGSLPGRELAEGENPDSSVPHSVTSLAFATVPVFQGGGSRRVTGALTADSASVGIALEGFGSGYWVVPAGELDAQTGDLAFSTIADLDETILPGLHTLRAAAIGEDGSSGTQLSRNFCVSGAVPDNLHGCDEKNPLPKAVISLSWDTNVDLDLQVITPDGQIVEPKRPNITADAGAEPVAAGRIDRDSNANCAIDGVRRESLVWPTQAPTGLFQIYANLADACRQPVVHFKVGVYTPQLADDGSEQLHLWLEKSGVLTDVQVNPGSARGLFVSEFLFQ